MMMGIPRSFSFSAYPRRNEYCKTSLTPKIGGYDRRRTRIDEEEKMRSGRRSSRTMINYYYPPVTSS